MFFVLFSFQSASKFLPQLNFRTSYIDPFHFADNQRCLLVGGSLQHPHNAAEPPGHHRLKRVRQCLPARRQDRHDHVHRPGAWGPHRGAGSRLSDALRRSVARGPGHHERVHAHRRERPHH